MHLTMPGSRNCSDSTARHGPTGIVTAETASINTLESSTEVRSGRSAQPSRGASPSVRWTASDLHWQPNGGYPPSRIYCQPHEPH